MLKKLHYRLTAICTLFTAIVVITITVSCLYISESSQREKEYGVFLSHISSAYTHLQSEELITLKWFATIESESRASLYVEDNNYPLFASVRKKNSTELALSEAVKTEAAEVYHLNIDVRSSLRQESQLLDFTYRDADKKEYFAAVAYINRDNGYIGMVMIYALEDFQRTMLMQRWLFVLVDLVAVILLGLFSYIFTGYTIKPVEKNRQKQTQFVSAASHELRSPLTVIRSSLSAKKKADLEKNRRFDEIIQSEVLRMERLVGDMLSLSRVDTDSWIVQPEETDIKALAYGIYESYLPLAAEKEIRLHWNCELTEPVYSLCDTQRIEQVLIILLNNALSYTPAGGTIEVILLRTKRKCILQIADNGIGISEEDKAHIFDRFYRADSSHNSKEHFGLGLSIAREIIRLHKGSISITDTPGGGSTFSVSLSLCKYKQN